MNEYEQFSENIDETIKNTPEIQTFLKEVKVLMDKQNNGEISFQDFNDEVVKLVDKSSINPEMCGLLMMKLMTLGSDWSSLWK